MKTHPAFPPLSCRYGAPMGRSDNGPSPTPDRLHLVRARMSACGAYDAGGAYWGTGTPLYCAWSADGFRRYFRAPSRRAALAIAAEHQESPGYLWIVRLPCGAYLRHRDRTAWSKRTARRHAAETDGTLEPATIAQETP